MLTLTNSLFRLAKPIFLAGLSMSFFILGCGSPYLEKGFKSEEDYDFAQSVNLSPRGVDLFKSARVMNAEQYRAALKEMHITKYSNSDDANDVWRYVQDRVEGDKLGLSATQQRDARNAEAARKEAARAEAERLAALQRAEAKRLAALQRAEEERLWAKQRADEEAATNAKKAAAEQELAQKRLESKNYVRGRLDDLKSKGAWQTDVINLIVNFQAYKDKRVFLKCWISYVGSKGGTCYSGNENQRIMISANGINKDDFRWLLNNCTESRRKNSDSCSAAHILGTAAIVEGELALINVSIHNVCQNGEASSLSWVWNEFCPVPNK